MRTLRTLQLSALSRTSAALEVVARAFIIAIASAIIFLAGGLGTPTPAWAVCYSPGSALPLNTAGTVAVYQTCGGDDVSYEIPLRNPVTFDGVQFTRLFATTNSVIAFGREDNAYANWPSTPSISLYARDWWDVQDDTRFDISISDGGFQIEYVARPYGNYGAAVTTITITGILSQDGSVELSYTQSGPLYGGERSGVVLNNGTVLTLEQYGILKTSAPPEIPTTPVASINWSDQGLDTSNQEVLLGESVSDSVAASGTGTIAYAFTGPSRSLTAGETSGAPSWLSINSSTGEITGTAPSSSSAHGTYVFRVAATATSGETVASTATNDLSMTIGSPPDLAGKTTSSTFSYSTSSSVSSADTAGYPAPTYSVSAGAIPTGMTLNSSTGAISGSPTSTGEHTFRVTATNVFGTSQSAVQSITVNRAPTFSPGDPLIVMTAVRGSAFSDSVSATAYPAATYEVTSGDMPPGLILNTETGTVSGVPSAIGEYEFGITASNVEGSATTYSTITVGSTPVIYVEDVPSPGFVGDSFYGEVLATGYPSVYYEIASGEMPPGLYLDEDSGEILGTPTDAGLYSFTIRATNALIDSLTATSDTFTVRIWERPVYAHSDAIEPITLLNESYSGYAAFTGVVDVYELLSCGCETSDTDFDGLPSGLSLNPETGHISGSTVVPGTFHFRLRASNGEGVSFGDSTVQTIQVQQIPEWTDNELPATATVDEPLSDSVAVNAYPAPEFALSGDVPAGIEIDTVTGEIWGTPTEPGTFEFSVHSINDAGSTTTAHTMG
ncbi:MAG: hypothetical protein RJA31_1183, partial [Actinomycetota bacterium]